MVEGGAVPMVQALRENLDLTIPGSQFLKLWSDVTGAAPSRSSWALPNMVDIAVKRVYEKPSNQDGARILVDRVWPRGIRKDQLQMDAWFKDIAPSTELRKWFNYDAGKWQDFRNRYLAELGDRRELAQELLQEQRKGKISLL